MDHDDRLRQATAFEKKRGTASGPYFKGRVVVVAMETGTQVSIFAESDEALVEAVATLVPNLTLNIEKVIDGALFRQSDVRDEP